MGIIFGTLFLRWRRATPMIIAHTLIDAVAFIGYALLVGHVSWLSSDYASGRWHSKRFTFCKIGYDCLSFTPYQRSLDALLDLVIVSRQSHCE